jgi:hypothetical protein
LRGFPVGVFSAFNHRAEKAEQGRHIDPESTAGLDVRWLGSLVGLVNERRPGTMMRPFTLVNGHLYRALAGTVNRWSKHAQFARVGSAENQRFG